MPEAAMQSSLRQNRLFGISPTMAGSSGWLLSLLTFLIFKGIQSLTFFGEGFKASGLLF